jgi:hypothetical protein
MTIIFASILAAVLFSTASFAQTIEKEYAQLKNWNVTAEYENGQFLGCFAWKENSAAQRGYGSVLRIAISDQLKILATDFNLSSTSQLTTLTIDNAIYQSTFLQFNQWAGMQLSSDTLQALREGSQVNFNFDPSGPVFSLSGSYAAVLKAQECATHLALEPQSSMPVSANNQEYCPNNDQKLPESGLCMADARKLLDHHADPHPTVNKGCSWEVNETAMPGGEFLLYNAYKCKDTTAKLAFQGGAKFATLAISQSAFLGVQAIGTELVTIGSISDNNVISSVLDYVRSQMEPGEQNNQCFVQPGQAYDLPANSYVVNVDAKYLDHKHTDDGYLKAAASNADIAASCGNWGYLPSSYSLWRAFGGFTWFFDFGQDVSEFDPASFSLITQNGQGQWQVVK